MRTNCPRRLADHDYAGIYQYFLTFCALRRAPAFENAEAVALVWSQFLRAGQEERFSIIVCCFMPDHAHLVVEGLDDGAELKRFISRAKQMSGYYYKQRYGTPLWQRYSYEHVLRSEEPAPVVVGYVLENPVRAGLADDVRDYPHVRSSVYERDELIEYAYGARSRSG